MLPAVLSSRSSGFCFFSCKVAFCDRLRLKGDPGSLCGSRCGGDYTISAHFTPWKRRHGLERGTWTFGCEIAITCGEAGSCHGEVRHVVFDEADTLCDTFYEKDWRIRMLAQCWIFVQLVFLDCHFMGQGLEQAPGRPGEGLSNKTTGTLDTAPPIFRCLLQLV